MKPILFSIFTLLLLANGFSQTKNSRVPNSPSPLNAIKTSDSIIVKENDTLVYAVVDQQAEFPGGMYAMRNFIGKNISYPPEEMKRGIQGKCIIKFVINKDGRVAEASVLKGVPDGPNCDKEALRIVRKMPNWRPAILKGKPVRVYYQLPVQFMLAEGE
jgi:periplasmic protein TonB